MQINFNVTGTDRKALVAAIGEITDCKPRYLGAPGFAFQVGGCVVSKDGVVTFDELQDGDALADLLAQLEGLGFAHEKDQYAYDGSDASVAEPETGAGDIGSCDEGVYENAADYSDNEVRAYTEADAAENTDDSLDECTAPTGIEPEEINSSCTATPIVSGEPEDGILSIDIPLSDFSDTAVKNLENLIVSKG
jgi:hypothetical protein